MATKRGEVLGGVSPPNGGMVSPPGGVPSPLWVTSGSGGAPSPENFC